MPMKLLVRGLGPIVLLACTVSAGVQPARAQQPVAAPPVARTHQIQPTLDMQATATSNSELARGSSARGKKELILSVTPGVGFQMKGAQSELVGRFQLEGLRYVRGTQSDRILPSGDVRWSLEAVKDAIGLDSTLRAQQVRASTTAQQLGPASTDNSYTDTTLHLMPYMRGRVDANTIAEIRLDRGLLRSTENSAALSGDAERDAYTSDDRIRLTRRPVPLGYEVQLLDRRDRYKGSPEPALAQREGSITLLMAPDPELNVGLKLLRARDSLQGQTFHNTSVGYQLQWRPTARTVFQAETENRSYGRTWMADLQHRWRRVSAGIRAERMATSYARESGRTVVTAPSLTPDTPVPGSIAGAPEPSQPFDTGAQLRQAIQGRVVIMGRRNQVNFAAGQIRSSSLIAAGSGGVATGGRSTREHYFETELTHQLTPRDSVSGGLRWGRSWTTQPLTGVGVLSRDFVMRAAFSTKLAPDTTATMGLKRQITHSDPVTSANETAGYVGLGHRF